MVSFFSLLLLAAATVTTTAQEAKPKLAVLVVGMDDWRIGDVLAHLVGEELNRANTYDVVTRRNDVQNKLKALRRGTEMLNDDLLRTWATAQEIDNLCVVTTTSGLNFSLKLLDVSSGAVQCSGSSVEPNAVSLKQLAWSLTGSIGDGCTPSGSWGDYICPSIEMEMVYVEGGEFRMGCAGTRDYGTNGVTSGNNNLCFSNEEPDHDVTLNSFWIGKYEVTQGHWEAVMGTSIDEQRAKATSSTSLYGAGFHYPVYYVSWYEAKAFCDTLSARTGMTYRLPTEEEWEYAARGGKLSRDYIFSGSNIIDSVAWYNFNSGDDGGTNKKTHRVGTTQKRGNELGICDMSGNVGEWCFNNWRDNYSSAEDAEDGSYRVIRGSGWSANEQSCRIAYRSYNGPSSRNNYVGFRVV
jgi:formylglycine-generating enzyme required for sulfatase activity